MGEISVKDWSGGLNKRLPGNRIADNECQDATDLNLTNFRMDTVKGVDTGNTASGDYKFRGEWVEDEDADKFVEYADSLVSSYNTGTKIPKYRRFKANGGLTEDTDVGVPPKPSSTPSATIESPFGEIGGDKAALTKKALCHHSVLASFGDAATSVTATTGDFSSIGAFPDADYVHHYGTKIASFDGTKVYVHDRALAGGSIALTAEKTPEYKERWWFQDGYWVGVNGDKTSGGVSVVDFSGVSGVTSYDTGDIPIAATGELTITAGADSEDTLIVKVNGVSLYTTAVVHSNPDANHYSTATAVAAAINGFTSSPNYTATASGAIVKITAATPGSASNAHVVEGVVAGDLTVGSVINMIGGADSLADLSFTAAAYTDSSVETTSSSGYVDGWVDGTTDDYWSVTSSTEDVIVSRVREGKWWTQNAQFDTSTGNAFAKVRNGTVTEGFGRTFAVIRKSGSALKINGYLSGATVTINSVDYTVAFPLAIASVTTANGYICEFYDMHPNTNTGTGYSTAKKGYAYKSTELPFKNYFTGLIDKNYFIPGYFEANGEIEFSVDGDFLMALGFKDGQTPFSESGKGVWAIADTTSTDDKVSFNFTPSGGSLTPMLIFKGSTTESRVLHINRSYVESDNSDNTDYSTTHPDPHQYKGNAEYSWGSLPESIRSPSAQLVHNTGSVYPLKSTHIARIPLSVATVEQGYMNATQYLEPYYGSNGNTLSSIWDWRQANKAVTVCGNIEGGLYRMWISNTISDSHTNSGGSSEVRLAETSAITESGTVLTDSNSKLFHKNSGSKTDKRSYVSRGTAYKEAEALESFNSFYVGSNSYVFYTSGGKEWGTGSYQIRYITDGDLAPFNSSTADTGNNPTSGWVSVNFGHTHSSVKVASDKILFYNSGLDVVIPTATGVTTRTKRSYGVTEEVIGVNYLDEGYLLFNSVRNETYVVDVNNSNERSVYTLPYESVLWYEVGTKKFYGFNYDTTTSKFTSYESAYTFRFSEISSPVVLKSGSALSDGVVSDWSLSATVQECFSDDASAQRNKYILFQASTAQNWELVINPATHSQYFKIVIDSLRSPYLTVIEDSFVALGTAVDADTDFYIDLDKQADKRIIQENDRVYATDDVDPRVVVDKIDESSSNTTTLPGNIKDKRIKIDGELSTLGSSPTVVFSNIVKKQFNHKWIPGVAQAQQSITITVDSSATFAAGLVSDNRKIHLVHDTDDLPDPSDGPVSLATQAGSTSDPVTYYPDYSSKTIIHRVRAPVNIFTVGNHGFATGDYCHFDQKVPSTLTSITGGGSTTATARTYNINRLIQGDKVTIAGAIEDEYNVEDVGIFKADTAKGTFNITGANTVAGTSNRIVQIKVGEEKLLKRDVRFTIDNYTTAKAVAAAINGNTSTNYTASAGDVVVYIYAPEKGTLYNGYAISVEIPYQALYYDSAGIRVTEIQNLYGGTDDDGSSGSSDRFTYTMEEPEDDAVAVSGETLTWAGTESTEMPESTNYRVVKWDADNFQLITHDDYKTLYPEVAATGTLTVTGGTAAGHTFIPKVGDVAISGAVGHSTSDTDHHLTATAIKNAINAFTSTPNYTAESSGAVVTITAKPKGTTPNGLVVSAIVVSPAAVTATPMSGGFDANILAPLFSESDVGANSDSERWYAGRSMLFGQTRADGGDTYTTSSGGLNGLTYTVPGGVYYLKVKVQGRGGHHGSGQSFTVFTNGANSTSTTVTGAGGSGQYGGMAEGFIRVLPGQEFIIQSSTSNGAAYAGSGFSGDTRFYRDGWVDLTAPAGANGSDGTWTGTYNAPINSNYSAYYTNVSGVTGADGVTPDCTATSPENVEAFVEYNASPSGEQQSHVNHSSGVEGRTDQTGGIDIGAPSLVTVTPYFGASSDEITVSETDSEEPRVISGKQYVITEAGDTALGKWKELGAHYTDAGATFTALRDGESGDGTGKVVEPLGVRDNVSGQGGSTFNVTKFKDINTLAEPVKFSETILPDENKLYSAAHGMANGTFVNLSGVTGTLPNGLTSGGLYYIKNATTNDFQLSDTEGGSALFISDIGDSPNTASGGGFTFTAMINVALTFRRWVQKSRVWLPKEDYTKIKINSSGDIKYYQQGKTISGSTYPFGSYTVSESLPKRSSITVANGTDTFTLTAHGFTLNQKVRFTGTVLPGNIAAGTEYYVRDVADDTFKVSSTEDGLVFGISSDGTAVYVDHPTNATDANKGIDTVLSISASPGSLSFAYPSGTDYDSEYLPVVRSARDLISRGDYFYVDFDRHVVNTDGASLGQRDLYIKDGSINVVGGIDYQYAYSYLKERAGSGEIYTDGVPYKSVIFGTLEGAPSEASISIPSSNTQEDYFIRVQIPAVGDIANVDRVRIYRVGGNYNRYYYIGDLDVVDGRVAPFYDISKDVTSTAISPREFYNPPERSIYYITQASGFFFGAEDSRLRISNYGTFHSWDVATYIDFDDRITGIQEFSGRAVVFTDGGVFYINGGDASMMWPSMVPDSRGLPEKYRKTLTKFGSNLIWLGYEGVCVYSNNGIQLISNAKGDADLFEMNLPIGVVRNNVYYLLQTPDSDIERKGFALDFRRGIPPCITRISQTAESIVSIPSENRVYIRNTLDASSSGALAEGSTQSASFTSKEYDGGDANIDKVFLNAVLSYKGTGTITFFADDESSAFAEKALNTASKRRTTYVYPTHAKQAKQIYYKVTGNVVIYEMKMNLDIVAEYKAKQIFKWADVTYTGSPAISFSVDGEDAETTPALASTDKVKTVRVSYKGGVSGFVPHYRDASDTGEIVNVDYNSEAT